MVLVSAILVESLYGISVRPLKLTEMGSLANRIFLGRVVGVESAYDPVLGMDVTTYTFTVLEGIKGPGSGETVRIRQVGKPGAKTVPIPGLPEYHKGREVLVFLHPASRLGLTSPVGMLQGVFDPVVLSDGETGYLNGVGNSNLERSTGTALRERDASSSQAVPITIDEIRKAIDGSGTREAVPE